MRAKHWTGRVSVTYGHPYMIDVQDCDARLPSSGDTTDVYLDQLVRLSVIVGKVMKNIYTYVFLRLSSGSTLCLCFYICAALTLGYLFRQPGRLERHRRRQITGHSRRA